MRYTYLGSSSLRVSQIGLGTWQFGDRWWGWGGLYGEEEAIQAVRRSVELGVNFIDTAEVYGGGLSEQLVGKAIRGMRDELVIATKVWPTHYTYSGVIKACERSLRRIGIDVIDLYQLHWPNPLIPLGWTMRAMERLVAEGKIRHIGVSNFSLKQLLRAQEALKREEIVSNQVKYNMLERGAERELLPYAERNRITIIAYSPLAQGLLTGKYGPGNVPRDMVRRTNRLFDKRNMRRIERLVEVLRRIAAERGRAAAQVALNWLIKTPAVVAIPGAKNPRQAEENAGAADFTLSGEELRLIDEVLSGIELEGVLSRLMVIKRILSG